MYSSKVIAFLLMFRSFFCDCNWEPPKDGFDDNNFEYKIKKVGQMPVDIQESSGLSLADEPNTLFTHNDSGGDNHLFKVDFSGKLLGILPLDQTTNIDWEDIARDEYGNIYIGDFGNNLSKRKDLKIYKVSPDFKKVEKILFSYPDQQEFPPPKADRNFDCEAFFWYKGQLHLFSKNWGEKWMTHYILPDKPGIYKAFPAEQFFLNGMITAADISPDKKTVALLTYGKIYLFHLNADSGMLGHPYKCLNFFRAKQAEGLAFVNDTDFMVSNETGELFLVSSRKKIKQSKQR
jgi:hypothetical protein